MTPPCGKVESLVATFEGLGRSCPAVSGAVRKACALPVHGELLAPMEQEVASPASSLALSTSTEASVPPLPTLLPCLPSRAPELGPGKWTASRSQAAGAASPKAEAPHCSVRPAALPDVTKEEHTQASKQTPDGSDSLTLAASLLQAQLKKDLAGLPMYLQQQQALNEKPTALQFAIGAEEENDSITRAACIGLQQEYEAISVLAAAHMLHGMALPGTSGGCQQSEEPDAHGKGPLHLPLVEGVRAAQCHEQLPVPDCQLSEFCKDAGEALTGGVATTERDLRYSDAVRKISAMQEQCITAKAKVLALGQSFLRECMRTRKLQDQLQAASAERLQFQQQLEESQRLLSRVTAERGKLDLRLKQERSEAERLRAQFDALLAEHGELVARDMLQSHTLKGLKRVEQQLSEVIAERDQLASSLRHERGSVQHLQAQLEKLSAVTARHDHVMLSHKPGHDSARNLQELQANLQVLQEKITADHDEEILRQLFGQGANRTLAGYEPRRAA